MLLYYNVACLETYKISIDWKILVYGTGERLLSPSVTINCMTKLEI